MAQITPGTPTTGPSPGHSPGRAPPSLPGPPSTPLLPTVAPEDLEPPPPPELCFNSHGTQAQSKRRTLQQHQACRVRNQACASSPGVTTGLLPRALLRAALPKPGTSLGPGPGHTSMKNRAAAPWLSQREPGREAPAAVQPRRGSYGSENCCVPGSLAHGGSEHGNLTPSTSHQPHHVLILGPWCLPLPANRLLP